MAGRSHSQIEQTIESLLTLHVESANRACTLSATQREKLQLAGRGDLKEFFKLVDRARQQNHDIGQDQRKLSQFYSQASLIQGKLQQGIFVESSLYQKILRQTLNKGQVAQYEQLERGRQKFRYEARVELLFSKLASEIGLNADEEQRLVKLVLDGIGKRKNISDNDYFDDVSRLVNSKNNKLNEIP